MRIWDINPGYLNTQSLLGEHRELHGIVSVLINNKKGYSRHPETLRWVGFEWALMMRHELLVSEMKLRGYNHHSPIHLSLNKALWPLDFIDKPYTQFDILKEKYINKKSGRIIFPKTVYELWAHHKYSVMARDVKVYQSIGKEVAQLKKDDLEALSLKLVRLLKEIPSKQGIQNALEHMWSYVSKYCDNSSIIKKMTQKEFLLLIQDFAKEYNESYLLSSTALSELMVYIKERE